MKKTHIPTKNPSAQTEAVVAGHRSRWAARATVTGGGVFDLTTMPPDTAKEKLSPRAYELYLKRSKEWVENQMLPSFIKITNKGTRGYHYASMTLEDANKYLSEKGVAHYLEWKNNGN